MASADEATEDATLVIFGEDDVVREGPDRMCMMPVRILRDFTIFDANDGNSFASLETFQAGSTQAYRAGGLAYAFVDELQDEDDQNEEEMDLGLRLSTATIVAVDQEWDNDDHLL